MAISPKYKFDFLQITNNIFFNIQIVISRFDKTTFCQMEKQRFVRTWGSPTLLTSREISVFLQNIQYMFV